MNSLLKNYMRNFQENLSWKAILVIFLLLQVNSYLITYIFIPLPLAKDIELASGGLITSVQIAFLISLIFYYCVLRLLKVSLFDVNSCFQNGGLVGGLILLISAIFFLLFNYYYNPDSHRDTSFGYFIELFYGAVFEEVLYRLFFLVGLSQLLKKWLGNKSIWVSVILTSMMFSLGHLYYHIRIQSVSTGFFIWAFLVGVMLAWIYVRFNNILLVIFLHLLGNMSNLFLPLSYEGIVVTQLVWMFLAAILSILGPYIVRNTNKLFRSLSPQQK